MTHGDPKRGGRHGDAGLTIGRDSMKPVTLVFFVAFLFAPLMALNAAERLRYNRDIRPILSDNCFACHGPDTANQQAGLRLDVREAAIIPADSGNAAIIPGQPDASALVARILSKDEYELMPPADSHKRLSALQKQKLRQWIAEGAEYEPHWAFVPPKKSTEGNSIDDFICAELQKHGLSPSPPTSRETLIRRLALDLAELAAYTTLASTVINLDETITKE